MDKTFNLYIEYRSDGTQKLKPGRFIDKWLIDSSMRPEAKEEIVGTSLKFADMSVIISRMNLN